MQGPDSSKKGKAAGLHSKSMSRRRLWQCPIGWERFGRWSLCRHAGWQGVVFFHWWAGVGSAPVEIER
jgi:hypothetical protein